MRNNAYKGRMSQYKVRSLVDFINFRRTLKCHITSSQFKSMEDEEIEEAAFLRAVGADVDDDEDDDDDDHLYR